MISGSILIAIFGYFVLLLGVAFYTSRMPIASLFLLETETATGYWWPLE